MTTTKRIVAATIALLSLLPLAASAQASTPPIGPAPTLDVKWILPPRTSSFYDLDKAFAEGAGYETVENDDLTYPGHP